MKASPTRRHLIAAGLLCGALATAGSSRADDATSQAQRWKDLATSVFGNRAVQDGSAILQLDAPDRAQDASLVPVTIKSRNPTALAGIYLIVDNNPAPMAAHFTFGPDADPREIRLRVRVDQYTEMHAVAEGQDGRLYAVAHFVKAAGGCSAPVSANGGDALQGLGQMKLRVLQPYAAGKILQVQLLIRHPNFNGMQMDQLTRFYTPARFVNAVDVSYRGERVFHLDSDISLSTDPAITFAFVPKSEGDLDVVARDSNNTVFKKSFHLPVEGS